MLSNIHSGSPILAKSLFKGEPPKDGVWLGPRGGVWLGKTTKGRSGVQSALSRLCPPPRLCDRGLQCRPRQREGARGVGRWLRQKEFPAWARIDRLQHHPSGRAGLARYHRQRAHPWRNATATHRFVGAKNVRIWERSTRT